MNNNSNNDINNNPTPNNQIGSTPTPDFNTIFGIPPEPEPEPTQTVQPTETTQPSQTTETTQPVQPTETLEQAPSQNQSIQTTSDTNNIQDQNIETLNQPIEIPITELNNQPLPNYNELSPQNPNIIEYQNDHIDNDVLLRAYIGNNYDKITTQPFNIPAFLFTALYMFYRKMILYGILLIFANTIFLFVFKSAIISLIICVLVGLFFNKLYISFAKHKVIQIKDSHPNSSPEELRTLCTKKGGTSILTIILGIFAEIVIAIIAIITLALFGFTSLLKEVVNYTNWNITFEESNKNKEDENLIEDITIDNYMCYENTCTLTIVDKDSNSTEYTSKSLDTDYINLLVHYEDYIKINIYFTEKEITSIKTYIKDSNEDISDIKDEESLRKKLGLYTLGTYTETLTLTNIGIPGVGVKDDYSYTYSSYEFTDSKNNNYDMKYINPPSTLNLKEGQSYKVTFEVVKGTFEYEYNIKSVQ